jgi:hypothetical protein
MNKYAILTMVSLLRLPTEIIYSILSRTDKYSLFAFCCTSKECRVWLYDIPLWLGKVLTKFHDIVRLFTIPIWKVVMMSHRTITNGEFILYNDQGVYKMIDEDGKLTFYTFMRINMNILNYPANEQENELLIIQGSLYHNNLFIVINGHSVKHDGIMSEIELYYDHNNRMYKPKLFLNGLDISLNRIVYKLSSFRCMSLE